MSVETLRADVRTVHDELAATLNGSASGPLNALRRQGLESFERIGIPTVRHEEWKYTNLIPVFAEHHRIVGSSDTVPTDTPTHASTSFNTTTVRFTNGMWDASATESIPDGVAIEPLTDALVANDARVREAIGTCVTTEHPLAALNTAITTHGIVIRVSTSTHRETALHIEHTFSASNVAMLSHPRILVLMEHHAALRIVETHTSTGTAASTSIGVVEAILDEGADLTWVRVTDDRDDARHIGVFGAAVGRAAKLTSLTACLGGALTRNDLSIRLCDTTAEAYLYGVSVLKGTSLADNHTLVDHAVANCHSEELYKGVYDDRSTGVFNGKIIVREDAQKTTAYQSCRSLLLSDRAQMNAKPQLEIFADDVKCSHGATMGQLDKEAIFYLRARGIAEADAKRMLTMAFAEDVLDHCDWEVVREFLRERVHDLMA
jgi:Fe-S cluster assembly protein SufD